MVYSEGVFIYEDIKFKVDCENLSPHTDLKIIGLENVKGDKVS